MPKEKEEKPKKTKTTLSKISKDEKSIKETYIKTAAENKWGEGLSELFNAAIININQFPNFTFDKANPTVEDYLKKWAKKYNDFVLPSKKIKTAKKTCSDPAVIEMVRLALGLKNEEMNEKQKLHDVFMSAEIAQGNLLEEYIDSKIKNYGWIWCKGNTLTAIDFCSKDGGVLLQVKNKNNTENSSSNKIRKGTKIEKWYRLTSKKENDVYFPKFEWAVLNTIINNYFSNQEDDPSSKCDMSEEDYQKFLSEKLKENKKLISL